MVIISIHITAKVFHNGKHYAFLWWFILSLLHLCQVVQVVNQLLNAIELCLTSQRCSA